MKPPQTLETERLFLRQPITQDAIPIFEQYAREPKVTKYLTWQPHKSIKETERYVYRCISVWVNSSAFPYVLIRKEDTQLIGMIEICIDKYKVDLGYVLAKSEWGKGFMSEALKVITNWALSQDAICRIWAVCDVENIASTKVMEKIGMEKKGKLSRWLIHPNISKEPRDCYCYAMSK